MLAFVVLSNVVKSVSRQFRRRYEIIVLFYLVAGLIFTLYLHGADVVWMYGLATINFGLSRMMGRRPLYPWLLWLFNCVALFAVDYTNGFRGMFSYFGLEQLVCE
jgi:hypothetical protein